MQEMAKNTTRRRRSEELKPEEFKVFKNWYDKVPTKTDAEEEIGISRQILDNVILKKSASPETIHAIRQHFGMVG